MPKVIVVHAGYGCDTGCCGHIVMVDESQVGTFRFDHPFGQPTPEFVRQLVTEEYGPEHVADIDWDNCIVTDD